MSNAAVKDLLRDLKKDPTSLTEETIAAMDDDMLLQLERELNPTGQEIEDYDNDKVRTAIFSYTVPREQYNKRRLMTSLIGFLYRVHSEYEVPATDRQWDKKKKKKTAAPWSMEQIAGQMNTLNELAQQAYKAEQDSEKMRTTAMELDQDVKDADLLADTSNPEDLVALNIKKKELITVMQAADAETCRSRGLQWALMMKLGQYGKDIDDRVADFGKVASQHPELKKIIAKDQRAASGGTVRYEMPGKNALTLIKNFLNNWFEYNPDAHVRKAYDEFVIEKATGEVDLSGMGTFPVDRGDPTHMPLATLLADRPPFATPEDEANFTTFTASSSAYNSVLYVLRNESVLEALMSVVADGRVEHFKHYLMPITKDSKARPAVETIPSQDTFHRWEYYDAVNYEELRAATEAIYPEKSELELALVVHKVLEGTEAEVAAEFEEYCDINQDRIISEIKSAHLGKWTWVANFKENRKKINIYNRKTEILQRILERHAEDKKLGSDMVTKRIRNVKAKNIREHGPNAPGLAGYMAENGTVDAERGLSREEMLRLEQAGGDLKAARELKDLDEAKANLAILLNKKKQGKLNEDEERELADAHKTFKTAKEMIEVPDDSIQVDVFVTDGATGEFTKSKMYTQAESPEKAKKPATHPAGAPPNAPGFAHTGGGGGGASK